MDEGGMWDNLRPRLQALGLDPVRVENVLGAGTPDVNYTAGWVELKYLADWPKRSYTLVRIRKLEERPQQVAFLTQRWQRGGPAWLMLRVGYGLLLFAGADALAVKRGLARADLVSLACWDSWSHSSTELRQWLTWDIENLPPPQRSKLMRLRAGMSLQEVADDIDFDAAVQWDAARVMDAEAGSQDTNDLLDYWLT